MTKQEWLATVRKAILPVGVVITAALLYLHTLAPGTVYFQDVSEFQTKLHTLEVIHATGYPFYQMLGKLWLTLLPFGTVAWRVNLLSAFFSILTLVCLCCVLQRIHVRPWAIVSACGILACSRSFWSYSILASTYSMHLALVALTTLALLRWQEGQGTPVWFALACGVGMAHHRVFVIALPAFALAILLDPHTRRQPLWQWLKLGVLIAVPPLLSCVWLAGLGVWPLRSLFHFLFREGGKYVHHTQNLIVWGRRLVERIWPWLLDPFGLLPALLALAGLLSLIRPGAGKARQRTGVLLLALGALTLIFFSLVWIAPNNRRYFLQLDWVLAAGWGLAWDRGWELLRPWLRRRWLAWVIQAVLALASLAPMVRLYSTNLAALAPFRDGYADRVSREILATVESGATVFGGWVFGWPLRYYHSVEHLRPDVRVVVEPGDAHRAEASALASAGEPIYFREPMYGLDQEQSGYVWAPLAIGNLARALPAVPPLEHIEEIGQEFEGGVALRRFGFSTWPLPPDTFVRLWLDWEGTEKLKPKTGVLLRLDDAAGVTQWRYEVAWRRFAGNGSSQTDTYWVTPPTLTPGDYTLLVALYEPDTSRNLGEVEIGPIPIIAGPPLASERLVLENPLYPALRIPQETPDLHLLGYGFLDRELWVGHVVPLSLFWQVARVPEAPYTVSFTIEGHGERHAVGSGCPVPIPYPGALTESSCVLLVPNGVAGGRHLLSATVDNGQNQWNVPLRRVLVRDRPHTYRVPPMQHALAATLGDEIALLGYDLSPSTVRLGQDLTLTLYWRALVPGNAWLKVFAHLVGPDGTLVSQHDGPPAEGAAPTDQWLAREIIADQHIIPVPADAPIGEYTIYVGVYSPDTGERLPALDADGRPYPNNAVPLPAISTPDSISPAGESAP